MRVRVLYHDHCFDGAASAAFFSRFYEGKYAPDATFEFTGLAHKASQLFEDSLFDGDVNAIVDFKYSPDPRLTWWFDHHQSAFLSPQDAEHFRHDNSGKKLYDPSYASCTGFIAAVAKEKFGYQAEDLAQLVEWADIIDGAKYSSAQAAVEMQAPAMQLTLVIESAKGSEIIHKIIRWMRHSTLEQIIQKPGNPAAIYTSARASHPFHRRYSQPRKKRERRNLLRLNRRGPGRLQQIHSVLFISRVHLHGIGEHAEFPNQGLGRFEPMGSPTTPSQSGHNLRTLRRRRTSQGRRHQF